MTHFETGGFCTDQPDEFTLLTDTSGQGYIDTDVDGITATELAADQPPDISDDLPDDELQRAAEILDNEAPEVTDQFGQPIDIVSLSLAATEDGKNPYEGLDDWADTFDPGTLPCALGYEQYKHFFVDLEADSGHEDPQDAWRAAIDKGYSATEVEFDGDIEHAAACMRAFEQGVRFVFDRFAEKGVNLELPPVRIVSDPEIDTEDVPMAANANEILVNGVVLEETSLLTQGEVLYPAVDRQYGMTGTPEQIFTIIGVEEAHHNVHERLMPPVTEARPSRNAPLDVYHADEREFQALRWKVMAAKAFGMPDAMVNALEQNYQASKLLRRQAREAEQNAA